MHLINWLKSGFRGYGPVVPVLGVVLLLIGCGGVSDADFQQPSDEGLPPEAIAVRKAFESAEPAYRNPVEEALRLVKAGAINKSAYAEALPQVQRLAANPTISAEQKQALTALAEKLKSELGRR